MKTQKYKIYGWQLLISVIAVSISITGYFADSKTVLSDAQMSDVYGGSYEQCQSAGLDCSTISGPGCYIRDIGGGLGVCDGWIVIGNCNETRKTCQTAASGCCDPEEKDCNRTYTIYDCHWYEDECVPDWGSADPHNCGGQKDWCKNV